MGVASYTCKGRHFKMAEGGLSTSSGRQRRALLGDDDANMVFETSKEVSVVATFDQMNLSEDLLRGIYAYGENSLSLHICSVSRDRIFCLHFRI